MTDNKKRGRPKAINPRSKQYRIRLTDDECETLKTIAKKHNLSVSKLIRTQIIEGEYQMTINEYQKAGGKVYGAHLTAAEKKAMDIEIRRQLAEYDLKHANELDAMILWHLHEEFGFGPKRLKQFYDTFAVRLDELIKHYEMIDSDMVWLCTYKLKQYGIDIEEWNKQRRD